MPSPGGAHTSVLVGTALVTVAVAACLSSGPTRSPQVGAEPVELAPSAVESDASAAVAEARPRVSPTRTMEMDLVRIEPVAPEPPSSRAIRVPANLLVGLASDRDVVEIRCCSSPSKLFNRTAHLTLDGPVQLRPRASTSVDSPSLFFVQVSALKSGAQADELALRLDGRLTVSANAVFDARTDMYKVRVGPVPTRADAESLLPTLRKLGYPQGWIVREENLASRPGFLVARNGRAASSSAPLAFEGRHVVLDSEDGLVDFEGRRYRGRLVLFLNDRGKLNVINEIGLEDYLRGVVPKELGPDLYPELEALKAQAIAARTYTVRNLGEFLAEGYDICSTPRCQVYGGRDAEHPLSDRAIAETSGQLLISEHGDRDEIVDSMFSASCGGHTEDVSTVFPLKAAPYLKSRPCIESGLRTLEGPPGPARSLGRRVHLALEGAGGTQIPDPAPDDVRRFESAIEQIAKSARIAAPRPRLASFRVDDVRSYLQAKFDLLLDRRLLERVAGTDSGDGLPLRVPVEQATLWSAIQQLFRWSDDAEVDEAWRSETVVALAESLGLLRYETLLYDPGAGTEPGLVRIDGSSVRIPVEAPSLYRMIGTGPNAAARATPQSALELFPGQRVVGVAVAGAYVGLVAEATDDPPARVWAKSWRRYRSLDQLQNLVGERYPGFQLADVRGGERGSSGRWKTVELVSSSGAREVVEGLTIRWTLDLPDTWFDIQRVERNGTPGWSFVGRGRGHGVGLCQTGAFGMAAAGAGYEAILRHYYRGSRLESSRRDAPRLPWEATRRGP